MCRCVSVVRCSHQQLLLERWVLFSYKFMFPPGVTIRSSTEKLNLKGNFKEIEFFSYKSFIQHPDFMTFQIKVYAFFKVENIFAMENMFKVIKILNPPRIAFFITMQIIVKLRHLFMNFHKFCGWYLNGSLAVFAAAALKCIINLVRDRSAFVVTGRLNIFKPDLCFFIQGVIPACTMSGSLVFLTCMSEISFQQSWFQIFTFANHTHSETSVHCQDNARFFQELLL